MPTTKPKPSATATDVKLDRSKPTTATLKKPAASVEPTDRIYDNRDLESLDRLLLLALVDHADADDWFRGCLDELAGWTGLDQSTVEHHRLDLISRGLLEYSEEPEEAKPRDCPSHWCAPEMRAEHPQRIRLAEAAD